MRCFGSILIALALLVAAADAGEHAGARALIDKAIVAHGGVAALAKGQVVTAKTLGTFHGYEQTPVFYFKSEITNHGAERWRHILDGELQGQKFRIANGLDRNRGWVKMTGNGKQETRELTPTELEGRREGAYLTWISTLLPLSRPEFTLTLAGEETFRDAIWKKFAPFEVFQPAIGVRVVCDGHRDVTLFFDKESHLLVKTETRSRAGTPVEGKTETILRMHKPIEGVHRPMMLMTFHDGRPLWTHWVMEYKVAENAAPDMFAKP